jgi:RES domain-containing protein
LERRVHSVQRPEDDVSIEIEIPDECVDLVGALPNGWKDDLELTRKIGSEWLRSNRSLCLRIPSAVIPDFNYLINPAHPDIGSIKIVAVTAFEYDPRLF